MRGGKSSVALRVTKVFGLSSLKDWCINLYEDDDGLGRFQKDLGFYFGNVKFDICIRVSNAYVE